MIFFCGEYWMRAENGIIAGVGHPSCAEIYQVTGNKRVRLGRICQWENENQETYPRLSFRVTKSLRIIKNWGWVKVNSSDHLIPYKCTNKRNIETLIYDNV
jgi:hypothetical protein